MSPSLSACPLRAGRGLSALVGFPKLLYLLQQRERVQGQARDAPQKRGACDGFLLKALPWRALRAGTAVPLEFPTLPTRPLPT